MLDRTLPSIVASTFGLLCVLGSNSAEAQVFTSQRLAGQAHARAVPYRRPAPTGLYCSCPPTNANSDSVLAGVAQQPFVEGILVRVGWKDIEPVRGVYDFSLIEEQLVLAQQYGKGVALAIVQGSGSPTWLAAEGVQMIGYSFMGTPISRHAAWDPTYQTIWGESVQALGLAYRADNRITLVHVTNSTHNGFEMQLPIGAEATFVAAGYTQAGYIDSWKHSIDSFAAAFPIHPLDVEVHPVFGNDSVAQAVTAYGHLQLGPGYGTFAAWWSVHNANQAYPGMFTLLGNAAQNSFATVQVVGSWVTTPERFNNNLQEYQDAFTLAQSSGVRYMEVWNADLLDVGLSGFLDQMNTALKQ